MTQEWDRGQKQKSQFAAEWHWRVYKNTILPLFLEHCILGHSMLRILDIRVEIRMIQNGLLFSE